MKNQVNEFKKSIWGHSVFKRLSFKNLEHWVL